MPTPWDDLKTKATDALQQALGDLWKDAQKAEPFYTAIAEDVARETYLLATAISDKDKQLHQTNLEFLMATAYTRATALALEAQDKFMVVANDILGIAMKIIVPLLKGLVPGLPV